MNHPTTGSVTITLQDLHNAWDKSKRLAENYIGKPASDSTMVRVMAGELGLLPPVDPQNPRADLPTS